MSIWAFNVITNEAVLSNRSTKKKEFAFLIQLRAFSLPRLFWNDFKRWCVLNQVGQVDRGAEGWAVSGMTCLLAVLVPGVRGDGRIAVQALRFLVGGCSCWFWVCRQTGYKNIQVGGLNHRSPSHRAGFLITALVHKQETRLLLCSGYNRKGLGGTGRQYVSFVSKPTGTGVNLRSRCHKKKTQALAGHALGNKKQPATSLYFYISIRLFSLFRCRSFASMFSGSWSLVNSPIGSFFYLWTWQLYTTWNIYA